MFFEEATRIATELGGGATMGISRVGLAWLVGTMLGGGSTCSVRYEQELFPGASESASADRAVLALRLERLSGGLVVVPDGGELSPPLCSPDQVIRVLYMEVCGEVSGAYELLLPPKLPGVLTLCRDSDI